MRRAVLLATLLLASTPARAAAPASADAALSDAERSFCASEIDVVERRRKLFEAQGLSGAEIARKNEAHVAALTECREQLRKQQRSDVEQRQDLEEVTRRAGPNATERERQQVFREVRRERLASKSSSALTADEREELASGMGDELAATHHALDRAHARDPSFMRVVNTALSCYHGERKLQLKDLISSEESLLKLGTGDRQKLYGLKSELRQSEDVLERTQEAIRSIPGGFDRCTTPAVAVLTHCLAIRLASTRTEPACESEEIQQYIRFLK